MIRSEDFVDQRIDVIVLHKVTAASTQYVECILNNQCCLFYCQLPWPACLGIPCNILTVGTMESHAAKEKQS